MNAHLKAVMKYRSLFEKHGFENVEAVLGKVTPGAIRAMAQALEAPRPGDVFEYEDGFQQQVTDVKIMIVFSSGSTLFLDTFLAGQPRPVLLA